MEGVVGNLFKTICSRGWAIPPPAEPTKSKAELEREREARVERLVKEGLLKSERIKKALLKVQREDFIPYLYRDYTYMEVPLPLPGTQATISCPHSYPLFYEPLSLGEGDRFLEVGTGSGYGAAVAREVVGPEGLVVSIEIDPVTFEFARMNLEKSGYGDVVLVQADGGLGYPGLAPYDSIAITAACAEIPPPLIHQLSNDGKLIAPVMVNGIQELVLLEKTGGGMSRRGVSEVLYVPLQGIYGWEDQNAMTNELTVPELLTSSPRITGLSWGRLEVDGQRVFKDAKVFPGGAREWDWRETGTDHVPGIQPSDVEELVDRSATMIVLSTGFDSRLRVSPETLRLLRDHSIKFYVLPSQEAVKRYNEMRGKERVAGLFHSTC